uniref:Uncharacterized protein n=1 Tax=Anguilla anguilla TaxID=7936 RepID=A0A0E9S5H9_ANGAN
MMGIASSYKGVFHAFFYWLIFSMPRPDADCCMQED